MKETNLTEIADSLFKLLMYLNKSILNPNSIIKTFPMPPSHFKVMFFIAHHGSDSVSNIGSKLGISKPNMTPIVDNLIEEGFIERSSDPKDRRRIILVLTPKSVEFMKKQNMIIRNLLEDKLSLLSVEDLQSVKISIETLSNILTTIY